jgi:hypothetical protein
MATFTTSLFGHYAVDEPGRGPSPARPTEDVHVRVPADLKEGIDAAAERAGLPADLWLLETLGRSVASARA